MYGSLFKPSPCYWASESEHHTSCSQVVLICSYAINLAHAIKHMTNYTSWISHDTVNMALATTSLLTSTTIVTSLRSATFDTSFSSSIAKMHADSSCLPQNVLHSLSSYSSPIILFNAPILFSIMLTDMCFKMTEFRGCCTGTNMRVFCHYCCR